MLKFEFENFVVDPFAQAGKLIGKTYPDLSSVLKGCLLQSSRLFKKVEYPQRWVFGF
jgi:hypothetical protein